ncbi:hypothetical protein J1N35_040691 [Gossypium stocksii]|uniref:Uncharacterized protein n=1 Tax=Gossypium stocksii TaxID=47602 RepID=A0A9D3UEN6_9ROSI|nr:hypothetical protein J1N35_040691 [Gossypium stocksii]
MEDNNFKLFHKDFEEAFVPARPSIARFVILDPSNRPRMSYATKVTKGKGKGIIDLYYGLGDDQ